MKRVLFIAYFFPPLANSGTQRPLKFANYLPEFGWDPLVLTVDKPPDRQIDSGLLREVNPVLQVTRVPMASEIIGHALDALGSRCFARTGAGSAISWRLRDYFRSPDAYALWRPTAVRAGYRLFRQFGFDAIWATGYPWTSLLIGRDISRTTGRPLIADFRDPWTNEDLFDVQVEAKTRTCNRRLEQSVLEQASGIVGLAGMATDELQSLTRNRDGKRFETIANGFDRADFRSIESSPLPRRARFRVVYTGVWKEGYTLDTLYEAIRMLRDTSQITPRDLEVVAAGFEPGHAALQGVGEFVTELGRMPHAAALGLVHSADLLFLPAAAGRRQRMCLPGKLYEYAASGRPILAVADNPSEVSMFLNEIGGGVVVPPDDVGAIARTISAFRSNGAVTVPALQRGRLERYERRSLTGKLAELLDSVTGQAGSVGA